MTDLDALVKHKLAFAYSVCRGSKEQAMNGVSISFGFDFGTIVPIPNIVSTAQMASDLTKRREDICEWLMPFRAMLLEGWIAGLEYSEERDVVTFRFTRDGWLMAIAAHKELNSEPTA